MLVQSLKNCPQVLYMLTSGLTVHQYIIQVYNNILIQHVREHIVH